MGNASDLENSMKRADEFQTIPKTFSRQLKVLSSSKIDVIRSMNNAFYTNGINGSVTDGTNVTINTYNNPNLEEIATYISNANDTFIDVFTYGFNWTFNYLTGTITVLNGVDEEREVFLQGDIEYTTFTSILGNTPDGFEENIELYIIDDTDTEHLLPWGESITISETTKASVVLKNISGTDDDYDMFDQYGNPIILRIEYN